MASNIFSLDLGEKYIKAVDVEKTSKGLLARSATYSQHEFNPYVNSSDETLKSISSFISKLISDAKFSKREVNIVLPDSQSYTRIIEMPLLTDKELISAVRYQADQFIPVPIEKVNIDVFALEKDKKLNRSTILIIAANKETIQDAVKIAENATLLPQSVENESSAILRLLSTIYELRSAQKVEGTDMYINFGYTSSTVILFDTLKQIPIQLHNFPIGIDLFKRDLKANLNLQDEGIDELFRKNGFNSENTQYDLNAALASPLNELVSEIRRFIVASRSIVRGQILNVYFFGEGIMIAAMDSKLSSLLGTKLTVFNPHQFFVKNQVSDYFARDWPLLIPTIGGSIR